MLVIEDVHWIDRATRDLLTFLARNLTDERIAILLTFREHDLPRGHPDPRLAGRDRAVAVDRRRRARPPRCAGRRPPAAAHRRATTSPADVVDRVARRSDGNPLFVEELYASEGDDVAGPRSLTEVLLARIAQLDPGGAGGRRRGGGRRPAGRGAAAGAVLEIPEADVDEALRAAIAGWVLLLDAARERYRFRHELLREVVEDELLPGTRRRLHERFALRLQERPDLADPSPAGAAGELAVHFAEAGLADEAYEHSIRAADAADAVHAYADAYRHLERALDIEPKLPALAADTAGTDRAPPPHRRQRRSGR